MPDRGGHDEARRCRGGAAGESVLAGAVRAIAGDFARLTRMTMSLVAMIVARHPPSNPSAKIRSSGTAGSRSSVAVLLPGFGSLLGEPTTAVAEFSSVPVVPLATTPFTV